MMIVDNKKFPILNVIISRLQTSDWMLVQITENVGEFVDWNSGRRFEVVVREIEERNREGSRVCRICDQPIDPRESDVWDESRYQSVHVSCLQRENEETMRCDTR